MRAGSVSNSGGQQQQQPILTLKGIYPFLETTSFLSSFMRRNCCSEVASIWKKNLSFLLNWSASCWVLPVLSLFSFSLSLSKMIFLLPRQQQQLYK